MPVALHHIVVDTHDLPALARFWTQALGWSVLSEREREIVIGPDVDAPVGICFMPVTGPKTVKNRLHLDLTTSAADRDAEIARLLALGAGTPTSGRPATSPGRSSRIRRATSSAWSGRRRPSSGDPQARAVRVRPSGASTLTAACVVAAGPALVDDRHRDAELGRAPDEPQAGHHRQRRARAPAAARARSTSS